jgi:hypothetical protein
MPLASVYAARGRFPAAAVRYASVRQGPGSAWRTDGHGRRKKAATPSRLHCLQPLNWRFTSLRIDHSWLWLPALPVERHETNLKLYRRGAFGFDCSLALPGDLSGRDPDHRPRTSLHERGILQPVAALQVHHLRGHRPECPLGGCARRCSARLRTPPARAGRRTRAHALHDVASQATRFPSVTPSMPSGSPHAIAAVRGFPLRERRCRSGDRVPVPPAAGGGAEEADASGLAVRTRRHPV